MNEFVSFKQGQQLFSSWTDNLIENPDGQYKFASMRINAHQKKFVYNRQTYSLLDWFGDMGGLYDGLYLGISIVLNSYFKFS